jgi:hypothetical protein
MLAGMLYVETQASLLNLPPRQAVMGAGAVEFLLAHAGYDGVQYTPVRALYPTQFEELAEQGAVTSFHESWAHGADWAYRAILSGREESIARIEGLQAKLPQRVPTVVHPNGQLLGGRLPGGIIDYRMLRDQGVLGPLLHQPTVEVLHAWGLVKPGLGADQAAEQLKDVQQYHGFDGVALDLHHLVSRRGGRRLRPEWIKTFVAVLADQGMLQFPSEVQVSLRPDFGAASGDIDKLLHDGFATTITGGLLRHIKENLPATQRRLRVTAEVPASAFARRPGGYLWGNQVLRNVIVATFAG